MIVGADRIAGGIEVGDDVIGPPCPEGLVECLQGPPLPPAVTARAEIHGQAVHVYVPRGMDGRIATRAIAGIVGLFLLFILARALNAGGAALGGAGALLGGNKLPEYKQ